MPIPTIPSLPSIAYASHIPASGFGPGVAAAGGGGAGTGTLDTVILAETSLVHFWKLSEAAASATVSDSKGALSGTVNGATMGATTLTNDSETSASFNGSSNNIKMSSLWGSDASFSYEAMILRGATTSNPPFICSNGNNQSGTRISIGLDDGSITSPKFVLYLNGSIVATGTTAILVGNIYHVVGTYDGTNITLYVNGTQDVQTAHAAMAASGSTGTIGAAWNSFSGVAGQFWNGRISKMAYYNAALTSTQVSTHYAAR